MNMIIIHDISPPLESHTQTTRRSNHCFHNIHIDYAENVQVIEDAVIRNQYTRVDYHRCTLRLEIRLRGNS